MCVAYPNKALNALQTRNPEISNLKKIADQKEGRPWWFMIKPAIDSAKGTNKESWWDQWYNVSYGDNNHLPRRSETEEKW